MKYLKSAGGAAVALSVVLGSAPVSAQVLGAQRERAKEEQQRAKGGAAKIKLGERTLTISPPALAAIQELQAAVNAKDSANIPGKLAAAKAAAGTPDEKYLVAQLQLQAAVDAKDNAEIAAALSEQLATGLATAEEAQKLRLNIADLSFRAKNYDRAAAALDEALKANPSGTDEMILLAETRNAQGQKAEAISLMQRAIAAKKAAGQKPEEKLYKRALALAYESKAPATLALSRDWVAAYPNADSWRDALRVYRSLSNVDDSIMLDTLRLARATGALESEGEFQQYGFLSVTSTVPAEAKAVIEEGIAANAINGSDPRFKEIVAEATKKSAGQRDRLPELVADAKTSANPKLAQNAGDILYSYGEFAQAAEMYRTALTKSGADKDLLNLRLGMALARAGDRAGATTALNAVGGQRAELAKFWLVYAGTRT